MKRSFAMFPALLLAFAAHGAPFADPTQPSTLSAVEAGVPSGPRVESILIAPDRRLAVIDGQQVTVGSRLGSGTVMRISETEVVVSGTEGERTLKLFPEVARNSSMPGTKGRAR